MDIKELGIDSDSYLRRYLLNGLVLGPFLFVFYKIIVCFFPWVPIEKNIEAFSAIVTSFIIGILVNSLRLYKMAYGFFLFCGNNESYETFGNNRKKKSVMSFGICVKNIKDEVYIEKLDSVALKIQDHYLPNFRPDFGKTLNQKRINAEITVLTSFYLIFSLVFFLPLGYYHCYYKSHHISFLAVFVLIVIVLIVYISTRHTVIKELNELNTLTESLVSILKLYLEHCVDKNSSHDKEERINLYKSLMDELISNHLVKKNNEGYEIDI